jgi:predicted flap endonuclease-1-like 5' DNA nuclease
MITYADWLSQAGAFWYAGQSLLLMSMAYLVGCVFGCWFRRIQPQPVEAVATTMRPGVHEPLQEPTPVPIVPRAPQPVPTGRLRNAFEETNIPEPRPVARAPEPALTMDAIRSALAEKQRAPAPIAPLVPIVPAPPAQEDLKRIKGIGPEIERKLNALGVMRYQDIVRWTAADVDRTGQSIGAEIRITHENWIEQAAILAAGGETSFSRRVDRKEVLASPKDTWMPVAPTQVERQGMVSAEVKPRDPRMDPRKAAAAVAASAADIGRRIEQPVVPGATPAIPASEAANAARAAAAAAGTIKLKPASAPPPAATPAVTPVAPTPTSRPAVTPVAAAKAVLEPDDLKRIRGITPEIEKQLNSLGVNRFAQVAGWSPQAVEKASNVLGVSGRIERENWVEQAMILARGGETEYSRRLKQGAVPVAATPLAPLPQGGTHHDDLKRIRGVGIAIETKLNAMGVRTYADIARWTPGDADRFAGALDIPGRIERENWIGQAQVLASGQATEFSNRVDRGDVVPSKE